jgi:nucleoside diphosphate kinase
MRTANIQEMPGPTRQQARSARDGRPAGTASVCLGAEHAAPVLESLSVIARKRALFAVDSYFRDSWEDLCDLPADGIEAILRHHALLLLKPDAVAGRRLGAALAWLVEQGTVVAAERVRLDRHTVRAMWQYQWNVASRDRRDLADLIGRAGDSLALVVRMPADARPATVRLSAAKGAADPARREPWQLRHRLGNENFLLNFVHTADEPADLVRETGVLFDAPDRRRLYRQLLRGADATAVARAAVRQLYERSPARDLSLAGLIRRQYERLEGRTGPAARELASALSATEAGLNADWRGLCDLAGRAGVPLDDWDRVVLGTHLMVASESGTVPVLDGVPAHDWDQRPVAEILPPGWVVPGTRRQSGATVPVAGPVAAPVAPAVRTPTLRYDQAVPRHLVHKAGIDEVLVTDSAQVASDTFALAGELPLTHCYFNDLPTAGARFDLMAVLELCRQAGYVVTHRHLGVPTDRPFLLRGLGVELAPDIVFADQPDRLRVATSFEVERLYESSRPGLSGRLTFTTPDGRPVGTATLSCSWGPAAAYARMRAAARAAHGLGPRTGPPPAVRSPLTPATGVGRTAPRNVLLAGGGDGFVGGDGGFAAVDGGFAADLAIDVAYRGVFDHATDHVPGMLLIEAARQAALRAVAGGTARPAHALALSALDASFDAVAELDLPVRCVGTTGLPEEAGTGVSMSIRQNGASVCRIDTMVAVGAPGGERG